MWTNASLHCCPSLRVPHNREATCDVRRGVRCINRFDDLVAAGSEKAAKESGKLRVEGKDYVVKEADVILFRTSA